LDSVHTARAILLFPRSRRRSLEIDMGREPHGYLDNSPRHNGLLLLELCTNRQQS